MRNTVRMWLQKDHGHYGEFIRGRKDTPKLLPQDRRLDHPAAEGACYERGMVPLAELVPYWTGFLNPNSSQVPF